MNRLADAPPPEKDDDLDESLKGFDEDAAMRMLWAVGTYIISAGLAAAAYWTFDERLAAFAMGALGLFLSLGYVAITRKESQLEDLSRRHPHDPDRDRAQSPHYIPELDPLSPHRTRSAGQRAIWFMLGSGVFFGLLAAGLGFANLAPFWHMALAASFIALSPFIILFFV